MTKGLVSHLMATTALTVMQTREPPEHAYIRFLAAQLTAKDAKTMKVNPR